MKRAFYVTTHVLCIFDFEQPVKAANKGKTLDVRRDRCNSDSHFSPAGLMTLGTSFSDAAHKRKQSPNEHIQ